MMTDPTNKPLSTATFGAGCFWCVEAVFQKLDGIHSVASGYMGGTDEQANYRAVCTGTTGHAEVIQLQYDPATISYETLLDWLWRAHDPTTPNRQGGDSGPQYRSVIFYHNTAQREAAEASRAAAQAHFNAPIVTEITAASSFYPAEIEHRDYYRLNPAAPCAKMTA